MARRYQPKHARKSPAAPPRPGAEEPMPTQRVDGPARRRDADPGGTTATRPSSAGPTEATSPGARSREPAEVSPADPVAVRSRRGRRSRALVRAPSPYPAREETAARPAWWMRLRGLVGAGLLVTVGGVLVALAVGIVLVLLVIAAVATLA